jgi:CubicO group peptidase (beta-lactamase class C family)
MRRQLRQLTAVVVGAALGATAFAATTPSGKPEDVGLSTERLERVTELVERHLDAGSFSGAVTLVARDGRIVHHEAQGSMDLEANRPMREDAIFRIMSMTKPVIGVATMMMIEEGKVRLQDPISKFIPEWADMTVAIPQPSTGPGGPGGAANNAEPRYYTVPAERPVTVRDLLTHTSGVVSGQLSNGAARAVAAQPNETLADYIPRLGRVPLEFQPGSRWAYSAAAGFDVLSRVVEITSGTPIDRFVQERIFEPLGMENTSYRATIRGS